MDSAKSNYKADVPERLQYIDDIYIVNDNDNNHDTIVATTTKREGYRVGTYLYIHSGKTFSR